MGAWGRGGGGEDQGLTPDLFSLIIVTDTRPNYLCGRHHCDGTSGLLYIAGTRNCGTSL